MVLCAMLAVRIDCEGRLRNNSPTVQLHCLEICLGRFGFLLLLLFQSAQVLYSHPDAIQYHLLDRGRFEFLPIEKTN